MSVGGLKPQPLQKEDLHISAPVSRPSFARHVAGGLFTGLLLERAGNTPISPQIPIMSSTTVGGLLNPTVGSRYWRSVRVRMGGSRPWWSSFTSCRLQLPESLHRKHNATVPRWHRTWIYVNHEYIRQKCFLRLQYVQFKADHLSHLPRLSSESQTPNDQTD